MKRVDPTHVEVTRVPTLSGNHYYEVKVGAWGEVAGTFREECGGYVVRRKVFATREEATKETIRVRIRRHQNDIARLTKALEAL